MISSLRVRWLVMALAFIVPLVFAAFTGHAWEDYFITLRASRNLVEGNGLVFNIGERLHTFTSPLGVLLPALCTWLAGPNHEELALWFFRIISAVALAATAALVWRRASSLRLSPIGQLVLFGLLLADAKLTDFAINGMETALLVYFALLLWSELEAPEGPRVSVVALAVGGLMWTRPDAFVLGGAILVARFLFRDKASMAATLPWRAVVRGTLLGGLFYVPWFAWAWWYYGTPVPHTIVAKSGVTEPLNLAGILTVPWRVVTEHGFLFNPAYSGFGGWPSALVVFDRVLTIAAIFLWLVPRVPVVARRASFAVFLGTFYLKSIIAFPWYVPPWTALAIIALAFAWGGWAEAAKLAAVRSAARLTALSAVIIYAGVLMAVAWQMRAQQTFVETGVRRAIGEWLREQSTPGDTVFMEPLGYIGYFSQLKTYDYPGLSSPEVVAAIRSGAQDYSSVIDRLQPRWLVLRPFEIHHMRLSPRKVFERYDVARAWSARAQLDAIQFLPGRRWCEWESEYVVFRRKSDASKP